jgi:hypothetical protein
VVPQVFQLVELQDVILPSEEHFEKLFYAIIDYEQYLQQKMSIYYGLHISTNDDNDRNSKQSSLNHIWQRQKINKNNNKIYVGH